MNRSPLHGIHQDLGARFVDFGGWEMPVQYQSVLAEHRAVRTSSGVFDVTHLGRFELKGGGAHGALSRLLCNDIDKVEPGRAQYTLMLNQHAGIIDDLIVWWWGEGHYWVLPNASNHQRVMAAFAEEPACEVEDLQGATVMLALQGPRAPEIFESVIGGKPGRFRATRASFARGELAMAGTGYTGERGGEVCTDPETGGALLRALFEAGAQPCGLGSRDTLRLEAGLPLWGEDLDESTSPLEAGLGFAVSFEHDFVGRQALERQNEQGLDRLLVGFVLEARGIPRHGYRVRTDRGTGAVTSGNLSPMIDRGVGMAYVTPPPEDRGSGRIEVEIRGRWVPARLAKPPFHVE